MKLSFNSIPVMKNVDIKSKVNMFKKLEYANLIDEYKKSFYGDTSWLDIHSAFILKDGTILNGMTIMSLPFATKLLSLD